MTKKGPLIMLTERDFRAHARDYDGFCIKCHEFTEGGVEPDARKYHCEECNGSSVYGTEESLMMGYIGIKEDDQ